MSAIGWSSKAAKSCLKTCKGILHPYWPTWTWCTPKLWKALAAMLQWTFRVFLAMHMPFQQFWVVGRGISKLGCAKHCIWPARTPDVQEVREKQPWADGTAGGRFWESQYFEIVGLGCSSSSFSFSFSFSPCSGCTVPWGCLWRWLLQYCCPGSDRRVHWLLPERHDFSARHLFLSNLALLLLAFSGFSFSGTPHFFKVTIFFSQLLFTHPSLFLGRAMKKIQVKMSPARQLAEDLDRMTAPTPSTVLGKLKRTTHHSPHSKHHSWHWQKGSSHKGRW